MASRKKSGLGTNLRDLLGDAADLISTSYGSTPPELGGVSLPPEAPAPISRKRVRPGLGSSGIERIQNELAKFKVESETPTSETPTYEGPPGEPPETDKDEGRERLPFPEYIRPIVQSVKRSGFGSVRPDLHPEFYVGGPRSSTRVHAIQWIPLMQTAEEVFGDILVAFARPSLKQTAKDAGSLYVYRSKTEGLWNTFKVSSSLGSAVNSLLGVGVAYDVGYDSYYRKFHPEYDGVYIFDEVSKWRVIRPDNTIAGATKSKLSESIREELLKNDEYFL